MTRPRRRRTGRRSLPGSAVPGSPSYAEPLTWRTSPTPERSKPPCSGTCEASDARCLAAGLMVRSRLGLAHGDRRACPATTRFDVRLIWPQGQCVTGSLADRRAVHVSAGLGHPVLEPRRDEGHRALRWQRVQPEVTVPPAVAAAGAVLEQDQLPGLGVVREHRAPAGGSRPTAIGVEDAQPQSLIRRSWSTPVPVPFE